MRISWRENMDNGRCVLMVFTRAPDPGAVKTRLIPALGAEKAAELYRSFLEKTLQTGRSAGFEDIELWCYPDSDHPYFTSCRERFGAGLRVQRGDDLGDRMWFALSQTLKKNRHGIIIGCDSPELSADDLITAVEKLEEGYDNVIGPSIDGGYYLLGSKRADRGLFSDIAWGTETVLSETRERIRELNLRCYDLRELWDIDRPEDLKRWERENRKWDMGQEINTKYY